MARHCGGAGLGAPLAPHEPGRRGASREGGWTSAHRAPAYSLSALERYQDCPFKFFASDVLRLEEVPEDESSTASRTRPIHSRGVSALLRELGRARRRGHHPRIAGRGPCVDGRDRRTAAGAPAAGRCRARAARLRLGDFRQQRRRRVRARSLERRPRRLEAARASPRGWTSASVLRWTARAAQGCRRSHRPARGQPVAGHRLQNGFGPNRGARCRCRSTR